MIETTARVIENREIAPGYRMLSLHYDEPIAVGPGQFVMLAAEQSFEPLLRRALAVYRASAGRLTFLYQVLGRGTQVFARLGPGAMMRSLGPLGNVWRPPAAGPAVVVAGGIGSASVLMLIQSLVDRGIDTRVFFGASNSSAAIGCGLEDLTRLGIPLTLTTDDGSLGERGLVTSPLLRFMADAGPNATLYACGPWRMMAAVARIASDSGASCFVSLEAPMGCGFGVCVGCVFAVKGAPPGYGSYKRVCVDGSIFPAAIVKWEVEAMSH